MVELNNNIIPTVFKVKYHGSIFTSNCLKLLTLHIKENQPIPDSTGFVLLSTLNYPTTSKLIVYKSIIISLGFS